jgi:anti-sigma regulatory factor (Ser/Thr protein kinase)
VNGAGPTGDCSSGKMNSNVGSMGAEVTRIRLRPDDDCARRARRFVDEQLGELAGDEERENALLVTSELVTNAYKHGKGTIEVRLKPLRDQVLIEVLDEGKPGSVRLRQGGAHRGGWGLRIVNQLAHEWGVRQGATHVWAKLPLD